MHLGASFRPPQSAQKGGDFNFRQEKKPCSARENSQVRKHLPASQNDGPAGAKPHSKSLVRCPAGSNSGTPDVVVAGPRRRQKENTCRNGVHAAAPAVRESQMEGGAGVTTIWHVPSHEKQMAGQQATCLDRTVKKNPTQQAQTSLPGQDDFLAGEEVSTRRESKANALGKCESWPLRPRTHATRSTAATQRNRSTIEPRLRMGGTRGTRKRGQTGDGEPPAAGGGRFPPGPTRHGCRGGPRGVKTKRKKL